MKLDNFDKQLLYSLDEDSSKSLTKIGQELSTTPQLVKYRLERLEKNGFIQAYWPMIEFRKLGYFNVSYFLKLKNLSHEAEKGIYKYLLDRNDFNIVMRGDGYWDLHLTISAQNIFRTVEVFNHFYDKFHHHILSYDNAISVGFYQFRREYLSNDKKKQEYPPMAYTGGDVEKSPLSATTLKIIEALNQNSRQSYADLAKSLGMSREKVIYNIDKIKKENIWQSNTYLLDNDKIGYPRYRILLQVSNFTSVRFKDFFSFCQKNPNIVHLLRLFGNWQLLIDVEIESPEKLRELFRDTMKHYGDIILRIENTHVYKIDKFRDVPLKLT